MTDFVWDPSMPFMLYWNQIHTANTYMPSKFTWHHQHTFVLHAYADRKQLSTAVSKYHLHYYFHQCTFTLKSSSSAWDAVLNGVILVSRLSVQEKHVLAFTCSLVGCHKSQPHKNTLNYICVVHPNRFFFTPSHSFAFLYLLFLPVKVCVRTQTELSNDWHFCTAFVCSSQLVNSPQPTV